MLIPTTLRDDWVSANKKLYEILWDDANKKALSTWYRDKENKTYKIEILEPCVVEINDEDQYNIFKFVLMRNKVKYNLI